MQISWDEWAVPTITGEDELDVTYGVGYAQAVAHAGQILELYGLTRGTAAAQWGPQFVDEDTFTAELGLKVATDEWVAAQAPETMARIGAFVDGFNAACTEDETRGAARREVLPVTPRDVVAHILRVYVRFNQIDPNELAFSPKAFYGAEKFAGSNAWAVAGSKSSTGNAMVMVNPHLSFQLPYHRFVEFRTVSPGRDFHGITLLGVPWQSMGYSKHVAWAHTVNPIRNLSVHEVPITDGSYEYDGKRLPVETREHKVEVLGQEPVVVVERRSVHGPIVTAPDGTDVAIRISGVLDHPATSSLEGWWRMSLATSVEELLAAHDRFPLPMFTLVGGDSSGSVVALFCGTPWNRTQGTLDDSLRRLPGDDPAWLFDEVHPAAAMPRVVNPASGFVQNCNETPWLFTSPLLQESDFVPGIAPRADQVNDLRAVISHEFFKRNEKVSPEQLLELKYGKRSVLADLVLDELLAAAAGEEDLQEAVEVLRSWDRQMNHDSQGYLLMWVWAQLNAPKMVAQTFWADWTPGELPTGLADVAAGVEALRNGVQLLTVLGVPLTASLGQIATFGTDDEGTPIPADGGAQILGALKCMEVLPTAAGLEPLIGDTWVSRIELRPDGEPIADSLLVYGNTTEPGAPPSKSQYRLWADDQLRPRS